MVRIVHCDERGAYQATPIENYISALSDGRRTSQLGVFVVTVARSLFPKLMDTTTCRHWVDGR